MRVVMGELNGVRLIDLMHAATSKCNRVTAAVAYATMSNSFFDHCIQSNIFLDFFGLLDDDSAVALPVLERLLQAGPLAASPRLVKGHFHSKIIWWHGFGAYIGSANLTSAAWSANVECGVFFEESEILGNQIQFDLEQQFDYLRANSSPVTTELVRALNGLRPLEAAAYRAKQNLKSQFDLATKGFPNHPGLVAAGPDSKPTAFTRFTTEWNETLELLRGLSREFQALNQKPSWVSPAANPTVHFDQFLHAYYYVRVRDDREDDESVKSVELVNRSFQRNRKDPKAALREGAEWWASLREAPYGEDVFIRDTSPMMSSNFSKDSLRTWTLDDLQKVFFEVHAFKMHARQVKNRLFGLPADHRESTRARSDRLAKWLWEQPRDPTQRHIRDVLEFLIWGAHPSNMVERLWSVMNDEQWRYDHLGQSTLGEAVGWARPDGYPPRNNRTNKALRSLGHDIRLFSD
jgi:hypothetical protein